MIRELDGKILANVSWSIVGKIGKKKRQLNVELKPSQQRVHLHSRRLGFLRHEFHVISISYDKIFGSLDFHGV